MRIFSLISTLLVVGNLTGTARGADLTKIDRTIAKEPAYESKPKYCLLVFGAEAKTRVWLVLDGMALYADCTGRGDLTGPDKRLKNVGPKDPKQAWYHTGPILAAGGKTRYPDVRVIVYETGRANKQVRIDVFLPEGFATAGADRQWIAEDSEPQFADRPADAPILHFDGPLRLALADPKQVFVRGDKPSPLRVVVGTPGLGRGTFAFLLFRSNAPAAVAQIAFPNRKAGGEPIVALVPLQAPF